MGIPTAMGGAVALTISVISSPVFATERSQWQYSVTPDFFDASIDTSAEIGTVEVTSRQNVYLPMVGYQLLDDHVKQDVVGGRNNALDLVITRTISFLPGQRQRGLPHSCTGPRK